MTVKNTAEKLKNVEILAPAGGMEHLIAAVRSGADAVYLGTGNFNARRSAVNFTGGTLNNAVSYCHERGVKVYVTLNTLVFDEEIALLQKEIEAIAHSGADAVIVQDLAAAKILRGTCPEIPLHASTQMTVHNVSGAKMLEKLGFKRVVLARELEAGEIGKIIAATGLEVEVFIHGALCMSVSGSCYISSMLGGRSGNRGHCAQPCRLNFKSADREYALSLKDLSSLKHMEKLVELGVSAFKIEGRMKRPEYVAAAVNACRKASSGEYYDIDLLRSVFSRGGFTDGYITGKRDLSMFGRRGKEDVEASAAALGSVGDIYRRERQSVPIDVRLELFPDGRSLINVNDECGNSVSLESLCAQAPQAEPLNAELALKSIAKTGGTPYYINNFNFSNPCGMFAPLASINSLRRDALTLLSEKRAIIKPHSYKNIAYEITPRTVESERKIRLRFQNTEQLFFNEAVDKIIIPITQIVKSPELIERLGERLIGELPELSFPAYEDSVKTLLVKLKSLGLANALTDNLYGFELLSSLGYAIHGGYGLNIVNTLSLEEYEHLGLQSATLSFELGAPRIQMLGGHIQRGILAYGYLPLMKFRNCPVKSGDACNTCGGNAILTDRLGTDFTVACNERQYSTLFNSVPLYVGDKTIKGIDFETLYFTKETKEEAFGIYDKYINRAKAFCKCTNGLYFRTVE